MLQSAKVMKEKIIKLYDFAELSEEAQQKAIDGLRDLNVTHEWYEFIIEDAKNIGLKITEFDTDRNRHAKGNFIESARECAELILKEHGENCETFKTAKQFLSDRDALVSKYSDGVKTDEVSEDNEYQFDQDCDELESEFLKSILEDYAIMLEKEYEYQTSDEAIKESIEANEYTFTEDGKLEN
jgi:hypothetical protein